MTFAGTARAVLVVEIATLIAAAGLDIVTVQLLLEPTGTVSGLQVKEDSTGVDHTVNVALRLLETSVAVMTADVSVPMDPAVALKRALELLAGTVTPEGTLTRVELELNETIVFVETNCERVTVQAAVAPDIIPFGLQDTDNTWMDAIRARVVLAELLL